MSIIGTAYVDVKANTRGFESGLTGQIGGIAKKAAAIFAGAFVFDKGVSLFKGFVDEANEARRVAAQVNQVIKSTGGVANVSAQDVDKLADSISRKSGIDDEAIASSEALLLSFNRIRNEAGKGNDIFNQATQAVADWSAVQGNLEGNSIAVGKALQDPIAGLAALARVGVKFNEQQKEQIANMVEVGNVAGAQKVILAELATEFGGQAAAQATAGQKLTVTIDNIREAIGTRLLPIVDRFATFLAERLPGAFDWASARLGEFVVALTPVYDVLAKIATFVIDNWQAVGIALGAGIVGATIAMHAFTAATVAAEAALAPVVATAAVAAAPFIAIGLAVAGVVAGLVYAYTHFEKFRDVVNATVGAVVTFLRDVVVPAITLALGYVVAQFDHVVAFVREQWPKIAQIAHAAMTGVKEAVERVVQVISFIWSTFGEFITRTIREVWGVVQRIIETVVTIMSKEIEIVLDLLTGKWGAAWNAAKDIVGAAIGLIKDLVLAGMRIVIDQVLGAIEALLRLASHLPIVGGKFKGLADDVDRFRDRVNVSLGGVETKAVAAANTVIGSVYAMETAMNRAAQLAATNPVANESFRALERASENAGPRFYKAGKAVGAALIGGAGGEVKAGGKKLADEVAKQAEAAAKKATERLTAIFSAVRAALGIGDARESLADLLSKQAGLGAEQAGLPGQIAAAQAKLAAAVADARSVTAEEQVAIEDAQAALDTASKSFAEGKITSAAYKVAQNNLTRAMTEAGAATEGARSAAEELADLQTRQRDIGAEITDLTKQITSATIALAASQRDANDALKDYKDAAPSQLGIFRDIATQAGLTKDQIDALVRSIGELAKVTGKTITVAPFVPPSVQTADQLLAASLGGAPTNQYNLAITGATLQPLDEEAIVEYQRRMDLMVHPL